MIYIVNTDGGLYSYADAYEPDLAHGNIFDRPLVDLVRGARHQKAVAAAEARMDAACGGCRRSLFVRDHFSRHLGAYMGFQIDAEAPGQVPDAVMLYP